MSRKFFRDAQRVNALRNKVYRAPGDEARHRLHAHGLIDAMLEDGDITWQEAIAKKKEWDRRHGY